MYASAMKFCGAMELCGIGYPTDKPVDHHWAAVMAQVEAQDAGLILGMTRGHKPHEAEFMLEKGFCAVYQFTNPRTGTRATLWIKDVSTGELGRWVTPTESPPQIVVRAASPAERIVGAMPPGLGGLVRRAREYENVDDAVILPYTAPVASVSSPEDLVPF